MTDMEGVAGVLDHDNWCQPPERGYPGRYYDLGRELLTEEVNACIEGLWRGGATGIVVADAHGAGGIDPLKLDRRAQLWRGWPEGWPNGLDDSYDAVVWVGQHAKAGTTRAHIAHTQWFNYLDESINGVSIGEFGQLALCAGELGIPAIFASGDEALAREAQDLVPGIMTVAVKRGVQPDSGDDLHTEAYMRHNLAAVHLHPTVARAAIRDAAQAALRRLQREGPDGKTVRLAPPYDRVTVYRPQEPEGQRTMRKVRHPSSVIEVLNMEGPLEPAE
jgi:D-amino peptidase